MVPAEKVSPRTIMNLFAGLILGLVLAIIIAALREIFDKRIRTEEDVEKRTWCSCTRFYPKIK